MINHYIITCNISSIGTKKDNVLPLPVTASAATSFPFKSIGMQAAYWEKCIVISNNIIIII